MHPLGEQDPKWVGPYRLLGRLGAGGMGQVYLGTDAGGERVAVKVVHPGLAYDERFRTRFRREVEISRRVTGPWVAAVVDADPDAPVPWLATQYVPGPSLGTAVETAGPLPAGTVHVLAHGLALALAAVHEAGLVHRDLKPSNVLLDGDHPRLIDFGISRALDGTRMTSTGMVIGTPAFMSPEQITGAEVGTASDVFSLGSVLFYAATGQSPFGDHPPVVLMMRISGHEPNLDGVAEPLRAPIAACLAKRPEDRPAATELGRLLGPVAHDTVGGPGPSPPTVPAAGSDPYAPTVPRTRAEPQLPGQDVPVASRRAALAAAGIVGLATVTAVAAPFFPVIEILTTSAPHVRWTVPFGRDVGLVGAWAADDSAVYAYDSRGVVRALDAVTGALRWRADAWKPEPHEPTFLEPAGGGFLVGGTPEAVAVFDTATGGRRWEVPAEAGHRFVQIEVTDGVVLTLSFFGNTLSSGGIAGFDIATGSRLWSSEPEFRASGLAAQDGGCFAAVDSTIAAMDPRSGGHLWRYAPGIRTVSWVIAAGDAVVAGYDETALAVDTATGRQRWRQPVAWDGLRATRRVLVVYREETANNRVVLRGLDPATGTERWSSPRVGSRGSTGPLVADGLVYVSVGGPAALDATTGTERWTYGHNTRQRWADAYFSVPVAARGPDAYFFDGSTRQLAAVRTME